MSKRSDLEAARYRWAAPIARLLMGKMRNVRGSPGTWIADDDPLAWWCLTELLVNGGPQKEVAKPRGRA